MDNDWRKWCRLCGKKESSDITLTFGNSETLALVVMKYFGIMISEEKNYCAKICIMCHDTISSIIKYNVYIVKVNKMFIELESNIFDPNLNIESFREKYGLSHEINGVYNNKMHVIDFCSVQAKIDVESKCENNSNAMPFKNISKAEILDVNNLEQKNTFDDPFSNELNIKDEIVAESLNETKTEQDCINLNRENERLTTNLNNTKDKCCECSICLKRFVSAKEKITHMKQKHSVKIGQPPYKCDVCGRIFKRMQYLNVHKTVHLSQNDRKLYDCPQCTKKFKYEWYVQDHVRVVHKREKPFICELCGSAFGKHTNLVGHLLTHSEEKKFNCSKCEKTFKCKRALKLHVDTHDDTQYVCQICGLKLNTKRILRRHMLVHSDQNKYKCNICPKQFKRPDAFKNHLILHTGLKPYECSFCELTFANGSNCRTHQKMSHPIELAAAESKGKQKLVKNVPSIKQLKAVNEQALIGKS